MSISNQAIIEDGAQIGRGCEIEPFVYIGKNVILGDNCVIKQGARIMGKSVIGANSKIFSYAIIGEICQDMGHVLNGDESVIIGDNAVIREFCTINSGTHKLANCDGSTRIGNDAFIMAYCHIAHDCRIGSNVIFANNATLGGHVEVGDYAVIGGLTPVHQFVKIGQSCMIAGASGVSGDIIPFTLAAGNHAWIRGINAVGLRRRFSKSVIDEISHAYKSLLKSKDLKATAENLKESSCEQVQIMGDFVLNNTRGIPLKRGLDD